MTSAWQKYKEKLGDTRPWDLVNPNAQWVSEDIADGRMNVCLDCDRLTSITKQCKECGCFMAAKTKLANANCPIGKW